MFRAARGWATIVSKHTCLMKAGKGVTTPPYSTSTSG